MSNLIERYVYDVVRRLPEKDREDVTCELTSNILDMLPEDADDAQAAKVLTELGAPAKLAEKYRQKPRYLISPAVYDEYLSVLKLVLPIVGCIVLLAGLILGAAEQIRTGAGSAAGYLSAMLSRGIEMSLSAMFQSLVWTTLGFAIADHMRGGRQAYEKWTAGDLPELPRHSGKRSIPLSDCIAEMVLTVVFAAVLLLMCTGELNNLLVILRGETHVVSIFNPAFVRACIPVIFAVTVAGIGEAVVKLICRRWNAQVCAAVILSNAVNVCAVIYLALRPAIVSDELRELFRAQHWDSFIQYWHWGELDFLLRSEGAEFTLMALAVAVLVVVCSLIECGAAVYKTLKGK